MCIKDKPKRILCIVGGMNAGGAETFLMKVYRALDRNKYQMDFYVATKEVGFYDKEITSMGGKIYYSVPKSKGLIKSFKSLMDTVKREEYNSVMRVSQHSLSTLDLIACKLGGAKELIYRSSNSSTGGGAVNQMLHVLFKWLPMTIPTFKIAPSTEAAEFMFGKNSVKKGKAKIINNAIAVENFEFNKTQRNMIREEFNVNNKFVIGHVGRFNNQKNHSFLIDIFSEVVKTYPDSVLMLVGKGELEKEVNDKILKMNLEGKVVFTGVRSDVPALMMAMDIFVFPSFFEGMPNTVIESQATGLHSIVADTITREANITELVEYMSLDESAEIWACKVLEYNNDYKRESMNIKFKQNMYDITTVVKCLEKNLFEYRGK